MYSLVEDFNEHRHNRDESFFPVIKILREWKRFIKG